jgi:hypothetical protein
MTPEFMRAMGSGADPSDEICVLGYNLFVEHMHKETDEDRTNKTVVRHLKGLIDAGEVDEEIGKGFLKWCLGLRKDLQAIEYWGNAIYHNEYILKEKEMVVEKFQTLEAATDKRLEIVNRFSSNPFDVVNLLKVVRHGNSMRTITVKNRQEIQEGFEYNLFNVKTGIFEVFNTVADLEIRLEEFIKREVERKLLTLKIFQKVEDPDEGFSVLKEVAGVS